LQLALLPPALRPKAFIWEIRLAVVQRAAASGRRLYHAGNEDLE